MKRIVLLLLIIGLVASCKQGSDSKPPATKPCSAIVLWEPPTERTGGDPLTQDELSKITIYVSRNDGQIEAEAEFIVDLTDVYLVQWEIINLKPGMHWFYMSVTDKDNNTSTYSNQLSKNCSR